MNRRLLPGMFDIIPNDEKELFRSVNYWQHIENTIRILCKDYGYQEIRTPILEKSSLFLRSSGEDSDIVSKELYSFTDKGEREVAMRPEGTAPVMRAYIDQSQEWQKAHNKFFYIGPMFRYDRPQAGRFRQHHQFGIEAIGQKGPEMDAEVIDLLYTLYQRLGLKDLTLEINSLGIKETREKYIEALVEYYTPKLNNLSADSQKRLQSNPLRILDSKEIGDIQINENAPKILDYLDEASKDHFESLKKWLDHLDIPYKVNGQLVRGLDYYNHTVFEILSSGIGAQNSIGGGGRYDGLIKQLGGSDLPAIGFGTGIERVLQTLIHQNSTPTLSKGVSLYFIPLGDKAMEKAILITKLLREKGISSEVDFSRKKVGKAMQLAHARKAKYVACLGDDEIENNTIKLKEMETGKEISLSFKEIISFFSPK
ncbi:histidine--tRNA ligase [Chlamydiales bacterium]|nr:histidine--tRNA ligase [Chlamydiales bacterium]